MCLADVPAGGDCWSEYYTPGYYVDPSNNDWTYIDAQYADTRYFQTGNEYTVSCAQGQSESRSLEEAGNICWEGFLPKLVNTKEGMCRENTVCFSSDFTREECEGIPNSVRAEFGGGYLLHEWETGAIAGVERQGSLYWDEMMGVCKVDRWNLYEDGAALSSFKNDCESFMDGPREGTGGEDDYSYSFSYGDDQHTHKHWNFNPSMYWQQGKYDTEELCTRGVCDLDIWAGYSEEECSALEYCSNWNCWGCERDYDNEASWSAPHEVCWVPNADNQTHCEETFESTWDATLDVCVEKSDFGGPSQCSHTYASCEVSEKAQCGGDTGLEFANPVIEKKLMCKVSAWSKCKTEQDCMGAGECHGGVRKHYCIYDEENNKHNCGARSHVCVAPQVEQGGDDNGGGGWLSCEAYGSWNDGVEWMEGSCSLAGVDTEELCSEIEGGVWTSTDVSEASCLEAKKCSLNGDWFNDMNPEECNKCEGNWKSTNTYSGNTWHSGSMKQMFKWKDREWKSKNEWIWEIDRWMVRNAVDQVIRLLEDSVQGEFVNCMYSGILNSIEKIGCVCGMNRDSCDQESVFGKTVKLVETEVYEGVAETVGNPQSTNIVVAQEGVEGSTTVVIEEELFVPETPDSTDRRLQEENEGGGGGDSLNSAGCSTVVVNENGALVGQLIGDCVRLDISTPFASPAILCISTKQSIEVNEAFDKPAVVTKSFKEGESGPSIYSLLDKDVYMKGGQLCMNVTESGLLCPAHITSEDAIDSIMDDIASGNCGIIDSIIGEVAVIEDCKNGNVDACESINYVEEEDNGAGGGGGGSGCGLFGCGDEEEEPEVAEVTFVEVRLEASISMTGLEVPDSEEDKQLLAQTLSHAILSTLDLPNGATVTILSIGGVAFSSRRVLTGNGKVDFAVTIPIVCTSVDDCGNSATDAAVAAGAVQETLVQATGEGCVNDCFTADTLLEAQAAVLAESGLSEEEIEEKQVAFQAAVENIEVEEATVDVGGISVGEPITVEVEVDSEGNIDLGDAMEEREEEEGEEEEEEGEGVGEVEGGNDDGDATLDGKAGNTATPKLMGAFLVGIVTLSFFE